MDSGSMIILNYLKETTKLSISSNVATAEPSDNALADARAALRREKDNRTVSRGNIDFLTLWISLYTKQQQEAEVKVSEDKSQLAQDEQAIKS
jgi:hypothetical protein